MSTLTAPTIDDFTATDFEQLAAAGAASARQGKSRDLIAARIKLTRLDGFAHASSVVAGRIHARMEQVGFFGGRDRAAAAARWAILADQFRDELTGAEHDALTETFRTAL
ncbi:hypothetical protein [Agromyces humi]|uniref:hypothetical protein n=1 Tax=Agromyces humi TaxID=1766800 RepID=UPI001359E120|nr:hypothetical protein [Agromyces humi]